MHKETKSAWATAVDAWRRLWSVGANGENIKNKSKTKNTKRKQPYTSNQRNQTTLTETSHANVSRIQSDLHGNRQETDDAEDYGDTMKAKTDATLRIMFHNINCLTESAPPLTKATN